MSHPLTVLTVAFAMAALTVPAFAEEAPRPRHKQVRSDTEPRQRQTDQSRSDTAQYERARARAYDNGSYSNYPDWARYALSPKL